MAVNAAEYSQEHCEALGPRALLGRKAGQLTAQLHRPSSGKDILGMFR